MSLILKAENISKQYRLGLIGTGSLKHDFKRWWYTVRGKEDPFLKVGGINKQESKASEDYIWALRNIDFEVKHGEVLGIIGKNGAGKSTLLKILSRVTAPTTGSIKVRGRIASLLEVGTGFHKELTGRENIFMNGAVLGMTKAEIKKNLDEIIDFSGCEMYIDTPVKRYSSGMTVRLGFAVAAHLEPEILVIDEVLAVGDAEFQKKAIGKMNSLSTGEGRTVLFVSHNMASVKNLCTRGILLKDGTLQFQGEIEEVINTYLNSGEESFNNESLAYYVENQKDHVFLLKNLRIYQDTSIGENFFSNREVIIELDYKILQKVLGLRIGFDLIDLASGAVIFRSFHDDDAKEINTGSKGDYFIRTSIPKNFLKRGAFAIKLVIGIHNVRWIIFNDNFSFKFHVFDIDGINTAYTDPRPGMIMPSLQWHHIKEK